MVGTNKIRTKGSINFPTSPRSCQMINQKLLTDTIYDVGNKIRAQRRNKFARVPLDEIGQIVFSTEQFCRHEKQQQQ